MAVLSIGGREMRRREFVLFLGGAVATWSVAALAQQPVIPVIGFLGSDTPHQYEDRLRASRLGLKENGYTEGQNVAIEYRWAEEAQRSIAGVGGRPGALPGCSSSSVYDTVGNGA